MNAVAVEPDGSTGSSQGVLEGLNADGSVDASFGNGGRVVETTAGSPTTFDSLLIEGDGTIVVGGSVNISINGGPNNAVPLLATYSPAAGFAFVNAFGRYTDLLAPDPADGRIIAAGSDPYGDTSVNRFTAPGAVDNTFNNFGLGFSLPATLHGPSRAGAVVVQPDGSILLASSVTGEQNNGSVTSASSALPRPACSTPASATAASSPCNNWPGWTASN